tara:strand:+ start:433 stop:960 length:528 start_codon:yes stop_codon:yes gene_type:complete
MNFSQAVKSALIEKYSTFSGRASRAEWWYFALFTIIVSIVVSALVAFTTFGSVDWEYVATLSENQATEFLLDSSFGIGTRISSVALSLIFFLPLMAVTVRRLQDLDASYYWALPYFIVSIISIWFAIFPSVEPAAVRLSAAGNLITILYCLAFLRKGGYEDNRFGANPLEEEDTY